MAACKKGYADIVKILLENGADPNIKTSGFSTELSALTLANDYGYDDIANMLVEHGASYSIEPDQIIDRIYKSTSDSQIINYPFSNAIKRIFMFEKEDSGLEFEVIKEIVDAGADVNNVVEGYNGLIYLIAGAGIISYMDTYKNKNKTNTIIELIQLFMEKGDNINETDPRGRSPLFYAVYGDSKGVVSFLLKHGADINIEDKEGETVLDIVKSNAVRKILEKYRK